MQSLQLPVPTTLHAWQALERTHGDALRELAQRVGCASGDCEAVAKWASAAETAIYSAVLRDANETMHGALRVRCFAPREDELLSQLEWVGVTDVTSRDFLQALLTWYEAVVEQHWEPARLRRAFRLATHVESPELVDALRASGYAFSHAEDRMHREAEGPPSGHGWEGLVLDAWSDVGVPLFFEAYHASFRDRPGFPNWAQARWADAFSGYDSFRPDLSFLVRDGDLPVAFLLAAVDPQCWVVQMGVVPSHRRRGLGATLLEEIRQRASGAGCRDLMLSVNVDNPGARRVYERAGYTRVGRTTVYRKG